MCISCVAVKLFLPFVFLFPAPTALWMFSFSCVRLRQQCSARNYDDLLVLRRTAGMAESKKIQSNAAHILLRLAGQNYIMLCVHIKLLSVGTLIAAPLHPGCVKFLVNVSLHTL
jgi:hypothetical protein